MLIHETLRHRWMVVAAVVYRRDQRGALSKLKNMKVRLFQRSRRRYLSGHIPGHLGEDWSAKTVQSLSALCFYWEDISG